MIIKDVTSRGQHCLFLALFFFLVFFVHSYIAFASEKTNFPESTQSKSQVKTLLKTEQRFDDVSEAEDQDVIYACPMHPNEISHKPGSSCGICGMFLVAQGKHDHDIDDLKHSRSTATGSNKHENIKTVERMQHEKMTMQQNSKPELFWQSSESPNIRKKQYSQRQSGQKNYPLTQRMQQPAQSTVQTGISTATAQNMLQSFVERDSNHIKKQQRTTYICPMHPQIMQHEPGGNCPICGMSLVAKETATPAGSVDKPQVFLEAAVIQNMGVRTAKVDRKILDKQIYTQGLVTADDDRLLSIHPRTGGWIEVLHLITEGDRVERKEVLVDFYSPWINRVQLDFIAALEEYDLTAFDPSKKTESAAKVESLRNSLRLLNVMDMDIMRIKNSRKVQNTIQLMAPQGGIVTRLNVNEGSYVEPYQSMFTIVDLSQVWVMVDIYEHQAPWVRKGQTVEITVPAIPARSWQGVVDFIYPEVDLKTRTLRARIVLPNPDEALLLNMFVKVNITANRNKQAVLTVPREAVIITGERETVIKSLGKGHFQPVDVKTGKRGEGSVEILSGLQQGDEIVVSGQFLIDSESSLQASFLRMSE